MYIPNNSLFKSSFFPGSSTYANSGGIGGAFADLLSSRLGSTSGTQTSSLQDVLKTLSERFPNLKLSSGEVDKGVEASKKQAEQEEGDQAIISPEVLDALPTDEKLAAMLEDLLSGLMGSGTANGLFNLPGTTMQRSISISISIVRYTEVYRNPDNGQTAAAAELEADMEDLRNSLRDSITDMIRRFFGDTEKDDDGSKQAAKENSDKKAEQQQSMSFTGFGFWRMQAFFSSSFAGSMAGGVNGGSMMSYAEEGGWLAGMTSFSFGFSVSSMRMGADGMYMNLMDQLRALANMARPQITGEEAVEPVEETPAGEGAPEAEQPAEAAAEA